MENAGEIVADSASTTGSRAHYVIDARRSRFTVQAFATGILSAMGHNPTIGIRTFSGEVDFDPDGLDASGLRLTIQAASLSVQDDISDKDRHEIERMMKGDVLEVAKYPEIRYEASTSSVSKLGDAMFSAALSGTLKLSRRNKEPAGCGAHHHDGRDVARLGRLHVEAIGLSN